MALVNPTANIILEQQQTGTNGNTWGDRGNANFGRIDQAVAGVANVSVTSGSATLTSVDSGDLTADAQIRAAVINATGSPAGAATITWPYAPTSKLYLLVNSSTQNVTYKVTGQTGITLAAGTRAKAWCNGTDIVMANPRPISGTTLTTTGTATIGGAMTVQAGGIAVTGNSTIAGTLGGLTGLTVASGGLTVSAGGANITGNSTIAGTLGGITGLTVASGGASVSGNSTVTGTLGVTGLLSATNPTGTGLAVTANATIGGTLGVTGTTTMAAANLSGLLTLSASGLKFADNTTMTTAPTSAASMLSAFKNLAVTANAGLATASVTADELTLENGSNSYVTLRAVNVSLNTGASGANGIDSGTVAANTWYSVWVIYDGVTVSGLLSTSATAPTLPGGYTYKARVGWIRTSATAAQNIGSRQYGRRAQWVVDGTVLTGMRVIGAASQGAPSTGTYVATAWGAFAPSTASRLTVVAKGTSSPARFAVAPNASYGSTGTLTNPPPIGADNANMQQVGDITLENSTNIWLGTETNANIFVFGWEDNI